MPRLLGPIDALLRERHLLKHPFYTAWSAGELPLETLRTYAGQYFQFESNFPRFVGATYAQLPRPQDRRVLLENLVDEEGRSPTHPDLWLDFAEGIGVSRERVKRSHPFGPTARLLSCYARETQASPERGLGALYAYESIFPEIAAEKSRGLREHYGVKSKAAHEFFRVHTEADVEHSKAEAGILTGMMRHSPTARKEALLASRRAIGAWWSFLDGFPLPSARPGAR